MGRECKAHTNVVACMRGKYGGSVSAQGNFLGYFRSLPQWVRQPILILSPFVGDPRECRGDIALPPSFGAHFVALNPILHPEVGLLPFIWTVGTCSPSCWEEHGSNC